MNFDIALKDNFLKYSHNRKISISSFLDVSKEEIIHKVMTVIYLFLSQYKLQKIYLKYN
jgi:hypothetical protein